MESLLKQLKATPDEVKEIRVNNFINMLREESKALIEVGENSKQEYRRLQTKLETILDINPTSTIDLSSKLSDINVKELINEIDSITNEMHVMSLIISKRVAVHNRLFPENTVEGLSEDELDFIKNIK